MKAFIGNKYIAGITQYINGEHFGPDDYIDWHRVTMGMSRAEYAAFFMSESSNVKMFNEFSLDESTSRSDGFVPGIISDEFEDLSINTEVYIDALDYSNSASDDLIVCYIEGSEKLLRVPKANLQLQDGEGI
jgi:hypothetical protein